MIMMIKIDNKPKSKIFEKLGKENAWEVNTWEINTWEVNTWESKYLDKDNTWLGK